MTKKQQREIIFNKFDGRCAYCGCKLEKGWHVDEVEPVQRGWRYKLDESGEPGHYATDKYGHNIKEYYMEHPERLNINNQMPACPSCNINKHSMSLEDFRKSITGFVNSLNQYSVQYKVAKRYGLIKEDVKPIVFYFEKFK